MRPVRSTCKQEGVMWLSLFCDEPVALGKALLVSLGELKAASGPVARFIEAWATPKLLVLLFGLSRIAASVIACQECTSLTSARPKSVHPVA